MSSLATKCIESLKNGVSVQAEVRDILSNEPLHVAKDLIAEEMSSFREQADSVINAIPDEDDRKRVMKRVNNVVNDVARICREEAEFTVKMKSRKGGYHYASESWTKPEPKAPKADPRDATIAELRGMVEKYEELLANPDESIRELITRHGQDNVGQAFVRNAKVD